MKKENYVKHNISTKPASTASTPVKVKGERDFLDNLLDENPTWEEANRASEFRHRELEDWFGRMLWVLLNSATPKIFTIGLGGSDPCLGIPRHG